MSTSTSKSCPSLPLELCIDIFSYATAPETVLPQHPRLFPRELELLLQRKLVKVTHTLTLVCKLWRAVELPRLYEIVQIKTPVVARRFLRTLVESASADPQAGYGRWVRHLVLPDLQKWDSWPRIHIINILERCPNLETLWNPYHSEHYHRSFRHGFGGPASRPPRAPFTLTSLRHIYWYFCDDDTQLSEFLSHAPHLVSLSIKSAVYEHHQIRPRIPLMSLTTIEYFGSGRVDVDLLPCHMPNLTRFTAPYNAFCCGNPTPMLSAFGRQLRAIEFLDIQLCIISPNPVPSILACCPNLETLGYNINCVLVEYITADIAFPPSLQYIVIRMNPKLRIDWPLEFYLPKHFEVLTGPALPALRRVVLDGIDTPFHLGYEIMRRRFPVQRVQGTSVVWECSAVGVEAEELRTSDV